MSGVITWINGKRYKVTDGGCRDCAFYNRGECEYAKEIGGVKRMLCQLKFGSHYEEVSNDKNN